MSLAWFIIVGVMIPALVALAAVLAAGDDWSDELDTWDNGLTL